MARTFGTGKYLLNTASVAVASVPISMSIWGNFSAPANNNVFFLGRDAGVYYGLTVGYVTSGRVGALTGKGSEAIAETTAAITTNTWCHCCAVFSATNSRTAYLNGGNSATETTSLVPDAMLHQEIGCFWDGSNAWGPVSGTLAEATLWNVALTASEVVALAAGVPSLLVRPASIVGYWPIYGLDSPERDFNPGIASTARRALTMTGTAALANHAPVAPSFFPRFPRHTYSGMEEEAASPLTINSAGAYASSSSYGSLPIICPIGF